MPPCRCDGMLLTLKCTDAQQAAADAFVAALHDQKSPQYHRKWLTPEQFGERFGVTRDDVDTASVWLRKQGFDVKGADLGRQTIQSTRTSPPSRRRVPYRDPLARSQRRTARRGT